MTRSAMMTQEPINNLKMPVCVVPGIVRISQVGGIGDEGG
jgi:hypothetical protein